MHKIDLENKKVQIFISILVVVLVLEGLVLLSQNFSPQNLANDVPHSYNPTSPYGVSAVTVSGGETLPIPVVGPAPIDNPSVSASWPRTYYVISSSVKAIKLQGGGERIYKYGDIITVDSNQQILEGKAKSGYIIGNNSGLLLYSILPAYQRVFPVSVKSYIDLPIDIKYKLLEKSNIFCGAQTSGDVDTIASILAGNLPNGLGIDYANLNNCASNFSMPRASFIADHAVAYANIDDNAKTPDHVVVVTENSQTNGANCSGNAVIFSIDADGKYFAKDLGSLYSVCYVDSVKKGTVVQITKTVTSADGTSSKEVKEDFVMPGDSFVVHTDNDGISYLVYDKTTSTQIKVILGKQGAYGGGAD